MENFINELAKKDDKIVLLVGDIGYGIFDDFRKDNPKRFFNLGICEQSLIALLLKVSARGIKNMGLHNNALLIERPFEQIKLDINQQNVNVKLIGFADYPELGPTHAEIDAEKLMGLFNNIKSFFPKSSEETEEAVNKCYNNIGPNFISLKTDKTIGRKW